jgi:hypothetical protein
VTSAGDEGVDASEEGSVAPAMSKLIRGEASDEEEGSAPRRVPGRQKQEAIKAKTDT